MASAGSAKSQRAKARSLAGVTPTRAWAREMLGLDRSHLIGDLDLRNIALRCPFPGQGHIPRDTDRLQFQDADQKEGKVGDHLLPDGEGVHDRQATGSQQRVVMLLVLALGGAQDDDRIIPDLELAVLATLARHSEQGHRRGLHGGEAIESGLQGVAIRHDER
jgi:hypothetical protein